MHVGKLRAATPGWQVRIRFTSATRILGANFLAALHSHDDMRFRGMFNFDPSARYYELLGLRKVDMPVRRLERESIVST